jgi:hypothetical protein
MAYSPRGLGWGCAAERESVLAPESESNKDPLVICASFRCAQNDRIEVIDGDPFVARCCAVFLFLQFTDPLPADDQQAPSLQGFDCFDEGDVILAEFDGEGFANVLSTVIDGSIGRGSADVHNSTVTGDSEPLGADVALAPVAAVREYVNVNVPSTQGIHGDFNRPCTRVDVLLPSFALTQPTEALIEAIQLLIQRSVRVSECEREESDRACFPVDECEESGDLVLSLSSGTGSAESILTAGASDSHGFSVVSLLDPRKRAAAIPTFEACS